VDVGAQLGERREGVMAIDIARKWRRFVAG
jgi:hypothetical protein